MVAPPVEDADALDAAAEVDRGRAARGVDVEVGAPADAVLDDERGASERWRAELDAGAERERVGGDVAEVDGLA
jgi:hypothetical protein